MYNLLLFIKYTTKSIKKSSTLRNAGVVFTLRVSGALLIFIFNWLIVKLLGVEESGVFFLAFTVLNVFSVLALYGVDQLMLRNISATDSETKVSYLYKTGFIFVLFMSLLASSLLFLTSNYLADLFKSEYLASVLRIISLTIPMMSLSTYLGMTVRAKKKFAESAFILTNSYYVTSVIVFIILLIIGDTSLNEVAYFFLFAMVTGFGFNFYLSSKTYNRALLIRRIGDGLSTFKGIFKDSYHLFVTSAVILGFGALNVLMVGFFLNDSDVSIFSVAEKIAKLLTFSLFAINIILSPVISRLYSKRKIKDLNIEIQKATLISVLFAVPLYVLFIAFPEYILGLFGDEYKDGATILRILSTGQLINAITGAVFISMVMTGMEKVINFVSIITLLFEVLLGAYLIPEYGLKGAAITAAVGYSLLNILLAYFLNKYRKLNIYPNIQLIRGLFRDAKNSTN